MEKERIELFSEERKRLTDGKNNSAASRVRRGGGAFFSTIALGVALFAVIFIICCFSGEFGKPAGAWQPDGTVSLAETSVNPPATSAESSGASPETTVAGSDNGEGGFLAVLKNFLASLGFSTGDNNDAPVSTAGEAETNAPVYDSKEELYNFDYSLVPQGEIPIVPKDMSLISYGETYIYNDTTYSPKISALLNSTEAIPAFNFLNTAVYPAGDPVVLIVHTHGTEAYSEEGSISYSDNGELARSDDITENVVAVGAVMAGVLNDNGIKTLHCTIMHDLESYKDSYSRSAATIREYLSRYPSIQYVIDVHRDSITTSSGALIRPVTLVDGCAAAQVMCVVGSDFSGADHPDWQNNLAFALKLRSALNTKYTNICRPVYLRGSAYNQQYAPMSMLLEVGASGNSLSEAKEAGRLAALALADIIKGKAG